MRNGQLPLFVDVLGQPAAGARANHLRALTYNPRSCHIKVDRAVVGRVDGLTYYPFAFRSEPVDAGTLGELLAKVRRMYG